MKTDGITIIFIIMLIGGSIGIAFAGYQSFSDNPKGYYKYHEHSGTIIGKNESRWAFYIETNRSVTTVIVDNVTFYQYEIGDHYEWVTWTFIRYGGLVNTTM